MNIVNYLYLKYRVLRWKIGYRDPIVGVLKLTRRCNSNCLHCPWTSGNKEDLSFSEWQKIIQNLYKKGCRILVIEGGEPTLRKDLNQLIRYAKDKYGLFVIVVTNGINDFSDILADQFIISIDGIGEAHNKIRGVKIFDRVVSNINKVKDRKKWILTTISRLNVGEIEKICDFFNNRVDFMWFSFYYPYKDLKNISLIRNEKKEVSNKLLTLKNKYKIINSDDYLMSVGNYSRCRSWLMLVVSADGKFSDGCYVDLLEPRNCAECDLPCHWEIDYYYQSFFR